ncbi:serine hydrolase [Nonomuraea sp. SMC257]|uniref:Serine hydrolase n=1 Tax=Nonomuraea montanisoli TaxID=2741721 RepID=A0A7Y6M300_9ACTN|nr:serine hydrolase [Nonomuraea montanisoli]NUW31996.1 serine hydrolase [Nonomuraea montanisoli]
MRRGSATSLVGAVTAAALLCGCGTGAAPPGTTTSPRGTLSAFPRATPSAIPRATLSAAPPAQPPPALGPAAVDAAVDRLDGIARDVMSRTGVPGMAVTVVYRDRVVHLKGYGVRRAGSPGAVGPDTVFQLASVSKPLATTVVARAVGQHAGGPRAVGWDDPVVRHDPGFALKDPWVTRHVTLADLFSHRSGLPDHAGDLMEDLGHDRRYILEHLRDEPLGPFRVQYAYTNFGFTEAALAVARTRGLSWEELSRTLLYEPLGMRSTSSSFAAYARAPDRAALHVRVGGRWEARHVRDPQAQSPAGGASSTARDLGSWLRLQLAGGVYAGRRLIERSALDRTYLPHILSAPPSAPYGRPGFYGLGWNVTYDDLGRLQLGHSGAFRLGAATNVTMLPSEGLGIVVLTNGEPVGAAEAVALTFLDVARHGRPTVDWLRLTGAAFARMERDERPATDYGRPPAHAAPARPARAYTGVYANAHYGPLTVAEEGGGLVMRLGPKPLRLPLRHYAGDTFSYRTPGENSVGLEGVRFTVGADGRAAKVTVAGLDHTGLGTFTRGAS